MGKSENQTEPSCPCAVRLSSLSTDQTQDYEEKVDDIDVELESSVDVFLWTQLMATILATDYHLGVEHKELEKKKTKMG